MTSPKIAIIGCGAIGSTFLAHLSRAGRDVTGIDPWPDNVHRVQAAGLQVDSVEESFSVRPTILFPDGVKRGQKFDIVVLATKGYDNRWAAIYGRDLLADDGIFISAQNGLHERYLPEVIGGGRVVGCVVGMGGELMGAGKLKFTTGTERTRVFFGELGEPGTGRPELLAEVCSALAPNEVTDDIWSELWSKMTLNVMSNGLAGISGYTAGKLWTDGTTTRLIIGIGHEVAQVAAAVGRIIGPVMKTIPGELLLAATSPGTPEWGEAVSRLRAHGEKRVGMRDNASSLLQDLRKGRRTEIDYFNGLIGEMGREVGINTPLNDIVVKAVHRIEEGRSETGEAFLKEIAGMAERYVSC